METVNNLAAAASKAIWGEQPAEGTDKTDSSSATGVTVPKSTRENETKGQEPLSGVLGNVEKGEPFDKGNDEPSTSTSASTTATDSVLESTKVLPLRPAGEAPAPNENIESSTTSKVEELKEKVLPTVPTVHSSTAPNSTSTPYETSTSSKVEELKEKVLPTVPTVHSATTPNSTSTPYENISHPTPFVSGLQGAETAAVQGAGGQQIEGSKTVDSPVGAGAGVVGESLPKEKAGADTSAIQGAGGAQIPGAKIADSPAAAENARLPPKPESHTTEPSAPIVPPKTTSGNTAGAPSVSPIVPSKVDSEDTTLGEDGKEGKEKLSLKEKIKAKLHHHKD